MDRDKKVFRFDDICINCDIDLANSIADTILEKFPEAVILYGVSPLVNDMGDYDGKDSQRIYPKIFNAYSDFRLFYRLDKCGLPENLHRKATVASHGLIHVDHRLLERSAQEMSILVSCSLTKSKIFIPPFNKWNRDTESICKENGIDLIKFEDGWKCVEYNEFDSNHNMWYLHHREFTEQSFKKWIS